MHPTKTINSYFQFICCCFFLDTVPESIDTKDLHKKLPFLEKTLREDDIKIIEAYVAEKVSDCTYLGFLKCTYLRSFAHHNTSLLNHLSSL